jgi:hypothetical protein
MGVRKMGELEGASATGFSSIVGGRNYSSPNFQFCGLSASGEPSETVQLKKGRRMI